MLKYCDYDIVFQEIPDQTTLAINLSRCPNRCEGCHSPQLREDIGEELTEQVIDLLLEKYGSAITCISLMGGDGDVESVAHFAAYIQSKGKLSAWYSGRAKVPQELDLNCFDYLKIGPYIAQFGGLKSKTTNQRIYRVQNGELVDITSRMQRSKAL